MSSYKIRIPHHLRLKAMTLGCVLLGINGPAVRSQQSPAPPAPHTGPALPGTHMAPRPSPQKPGVVLHIEGPAIVNQKKCAEHVFDIRYSVINNTVKPANGTIRIAFNGVSLNPTGSAKLNNLAPGREASGA